MAEKTILITGASAGFGEAIALKLAMPGRKLILLARRLERLEKLQAELPCKTVIAKVDLTKPEQIKTFFANLAPQDRKIDVLINNAGLVRGLDVAEEAELADWDVMLETNIRSLLHMTRQVLPDMVKRKQGMIINIGSVAATIPYKGGNCYGATKAFVRQFSRNLRTDLLGKGIKVTNIEPGAAETEFSLVRFKGDAKRAKDFYAGWKPLQAEDIANAVAWVLAQPEHVNIDNLEIMPLDQTYGGFGFNRS